ncbi:MAG: TrkA family potassium uptake protein, partial [Planctomycetia bacterium]|nr:TrkA family potassium uptake protein [Planctomycetia bacterium]
MRQIIVCGLGRFGLNVIEALREAGRQVTVISD